MKYIRTKDGVYEEDENLYFIEDNELYMKWDYPSKDFEHIGTIIAQADTIEELCDEFVLVYENKGNILVKKYNKESNVYFYKTKIGNVYMLNELTNLIENKLAIIYGAIWTSKGLIYVAKMDSEGNLKLI